MISSFCFVVLPVTWLLSAFNSEKISYGQRACVHTHVRSSPQQGSPHLCKLPHDLSLYHHSTWTNILNLWTLGHQVAELDPAILTITCSWVHIAHTNLVCSLGSTFFSGSAWISLIEIYCNNVQAVCRLSYKVTYNSEYKSHPLVKNQRLENRDT